MRFNQLHPPFDNPAIRRALLGAVDQADVMAAVAVNRPYWHDRVGLFHPDSPLANDAGIEVLSTHRDYDKVKHDLATAGYRGEPVALLSVSGNSLISVISQVGTDALRRVGMNVDLQVMDVGTLNRRLFNKGPPDKGGWNVFFGISDILSNLVPAANNWIRGDGGKAPPGWPSSPAFEALREAWLSAGEIDTERQIAREMQLQLWRDVPYIPLGHWVRPTAYRRDIVDIPWGTPLFYGLHRT
jgi:peptide/nickel transport system substrate-binding protein